MYEYSLFSVLGIEVEYMLVDETTLNVKPISDAILTELAGAITNEVALGDIAVSNELVMHVLELKNNGPKPVSNQVAQQFQTAINQLQPILQKNHVCLLPTGAHPWMDPHQETKRWPHGNKSIYNQYDSIFNCHGHGWANLQSMHVNLPFSNVEEFFYLHSVVRLILPLLPALAASTPLLDSAPTGILDSRLSFYENNQKKIPEISGGIIPEFIRSPQEYQEKILHPMYAAINPFDPNKILQYEWLNSRGAIAKFDYGAIEIRIIDSQENVDADIAIAHLTHAILKSWHETSAFHLENPCDTHELKAVYDQSCKQGLNFLNTSVKLMEQWQLPKREMLLRDIWSLLIERVSPNLDFKTQQVLENILKLGNLSERILQACKGEYSKSNLQRVYKELASCLINNQQFLPL